MFSFSSQYPEPPDRSAPYHPSAHRDIPGCCARRNSLCIRGYPYHSGKIPSLYSCCFQPLGKGLHQHGSIPLLPGTAGNHNNFLAHLHILLSSFIGAEILPPGGQRPLRRSLMHRPDHCLPFSSTFWSSPPFCEIAFSLCRYYNHSKNRTENKYAHQSAILTQK